MPLPKTLKKKHVIHARQNLCCSEYCHVVVQQVIVCVCMALRAYIVPIFM
jgi:hypothetical protein